MLKKYRIGFDVWGLILFLIIMMPNFVWFALPAPNDILREDSVTPVIDAAASAAQAVMIAVLCMVVPKNRSSMKITALIKTVILCCLTYYISWIFYYFGTVNAPVVLGLTAAPCLAFLFFAIDRKNLIAVIPITIFAICHMVYAVVNFIV